MKNNNLFIALILLLVFTSCKENTEQRSSDTTEMKENYEYLAVGTYTRKEGHVDGKAEGIYIYKMNTETGELSHVSTTGNSINPSYVTIHPSGKYLYAANEHGGDGEFDTGTVSAYKVNDDMTLTFLNRQSAHGAAPCYVSTFKNHVFVANYVTGNVVALPTKEDGSLEVASSIEQHTGKGNHARQDAAHAHYAAVVPNTNFIAAVDLGIDKVKFYDFSAEEGSLKMVNETALADESGARHLAFHPTNGLYYVINELSGTIESFKFDKQTAASAKVQTISTYPAEYKGGYACADIHITPNGKYLYASNRGDDNSIAMFSINEEDGTLTSIGWQSTQGKTPRNFAISPSGTFLLVANQDSGTVAIFKINADTGMLEDIGQLAEIPTPVCLKFF